MELAFISEREVPQLFDGYFEKRRVNKHSWTEQKKKNMLKELMTIEWNNNVYYWLEQGPSKPIWQSKANLPTLYLFWISKWEKMVKEKNILSKMKSVTQIKKWSTMEFQQKPAKFVPLD